METRLMRGVHYRRRRAFIEGYAFPRALTKKLREEFESEYQVPIALEGLRTWYLACLDAPGETLGMPSRAVDVAWHEMILMTRAYHHFCKRAFGRYLHHDPEAVMDEPMQAGLARTLSVVGNESIGGVPLLFAIDGRLGIENGYVWEPGDIARLRAAAPAQYAYVAGLGAPGHGGAACAGGGCGSGGGCGGGGCGGGG
jgi:hypothetical protein